ncbi:hypothetical protein KUTeg_000490 [Tegillarca granosa]|uniref:Uncharacterized protein n=1 Tax=Tegillarca granosa TaxID=220873 RepID=A0ABQ9FXT5_TEGGR|nr:hypothetical protein KUTeg_000490 [Tegillarca granosa]
MASGRYKDKGYGYLYWFSYFCAMVALLLVFTAFATPYWYKSWSRVHSPLGNIGLWSVCLSGWVKPRDPEMRSYVGCWWIHSTFFEDVYDQIMPPWFRAVQGLVILTMLCNMLVVFFLSIYCVQRIIDKVIVRRHILFFVSSIFMLIGGVLVLITSFVFAFKSKDPEWMPRPWLNYLSWSFGFNVLSGFFSFFGGVAAFIKYTEVHEKPEPSKSRNKEMDFSKPPPSYPGSAPSESYLPPEPYPPAVAYQPPPPPGVYWLRD